MEKKMPNNKKNEIDQIIDLIKAQSKLGKSPEEIIDSFVESGIPYEEIKPLVANVVYLLGDYVKDQIAIGKTSNEIIIDIIEKGADPKETNFLVTRYFLLNDVRDHLLKNLHETGEAKFDIQDPIFTKEENPIKFPEINNRFEVNTQKSLASGNGYRRMWRGAIILIIGTAITLSTYFNPSGSSYLICYGAIIFGAIDFFFGLIQWLGNR